MARSRILAIIPAFNEAANIGSVIRGLATCHIPLDAIVINDGSRDATEQVATDAGATVISLPYNLGIGGAVQTGLIYARDRGYDIAIQVDGDGQHRPDEIPIIIEPVLSGETDVAIGSRFICRTGFKSSFSRRMGIWVFRAAIYLATRQVITDSTSGFRAFNRRAIEYLAEHYPCDYPEVEVVVALKRNGFRLKEFPVEMAERHGGASSITPVKSLYYMVKVLLAVLVSFLRAPEKTTEKM